MFKKIHSIISLFMLGIFLALCAFPATAYAYSEKEPVTVKVGYYQNEVFEDGAEEGAVKKGYAYEYYRKLSEYAGWKYEYVYGDFVSIYKKLLNGEVDIVAGLAYTEERSDLLLYPDKPMGAESYGIVIHDDDFTITGDTDTLQGKTIGVLDSAIVDVLNDFLDSKGVDAEVITFNDYETLLASFDTRELDVIAAELDGIYERNHATVLYSFGESDYYLCVSRKRPALLKQLNEAQRQLYVDNPDYASYLRDKYFSSTLSSRALSPAEYEWLSEHSELKIGYLDHFLPFSDTDENGNATGIVSEIFPYLFQKLNINTLSYKYISFESYDDMMAAIAAGEIDVAFPVGGDLFYSEEDGLLITDPVISTLTDLVYMENHFDNEISDFAINKNNKLQYYYVKNNYPDATIKYYNSIEECLDAVAFCEVSYTTLNGLRTNMLMKKADEDLAFIQLGFRDDICFGTKIGNNGLVKLLDRGIKVIGQDYAQNLAFRYSQSLNTLTLRDFVQRYFWLVFVVFLLFAVVIIIFLYKNVQTNNKLIMEKENAQAEIEKANHEKFVFINKMANYMSEPIRKLKANILEAQKENNTERFYDDLSNMSNYVNELGTMINNILSMSRFESGQMHLEDRNRTRNFYDKRILIVEDSLQNKMITGKILKRFGFEIQVADDPIEACEKLNAAPEGYFDALFMDIEFKAEDAYNAVNKIRNMNSESKAQIPIVAITSEEMQESDAPFDKKGFDATIEKPYDVKNMDDVLSEIFA